MAFVSIPGMNFNGDRNRERPRHPGAEAFYAARGETSHDASGFDEGEECYFQGEPAKVIREERDPHSGDVDTYIQVSRRGDAGMYKVQWEPCGDRGMVIRNARRTSG